MFIKFIVLIGLFVIISMISALVGFLCEDVVHCSFGSIEIAFAFSTLLASLLATTLLC